MITYHKPLLVMVCKDVTTLSQWLQHIILNIHQCNVHVLYKPGPDLYIADCLSLHNHTEHEPQEISGMNINIKTLGIGTDLLVCTSAEDIRNAVSIDTEL